MPAAGDRGRRRLAWRRARRRGFGDSISPRNPPRPRIGYGLNSVGITSRSTRPTTATAHIATHFRHPDDRGVIVLSMATIAFPAVASSRLPATRCLSIALVAYYLVRDRVLCVCAGDRHVLMWRRRERGDCALPPAPRGHPRGALVPWAGRCRSSAQVRGRARLLRRREAAPIGPLSCAPRRSSGRREKLAATLHDALVGPPIAPRRRSLTPGEPPRH